jgi:lysophospholipase L1-like esterase
MPNAIFGDTMGQFCVEKSVQLAKYYKEQCELIGCHFADAGAMGCEFNQIDYMHLTRNGHAVLAENLAKLVPELL